MRKINNFDKIKLRTKDSNFKGKKYERTFYNLKIIDLGDTIEVYKYDDMIEINGISRKGSNKNNINDDDIEIKQELAEVSRKKSVQRTKNKLMKLLENNKDKFTTFITLTFRDEIEYKKSKDQLRKMLLKLDKAIENFYYCWVLELTEKGRPHFHIVCNYPVECETVTGKKRKPKEQKDLENNFINNYWCNGFVTISKLVSKDNAFKYITNYLGKGIESIRDYIPVGSRIYSCSRNLEKPKVNAFLVEDDPEEILNYFLQDNELIYSSNYCIGEYTDSTVTFFKFKKGIDDV